MSVHTALRALSIASLWSTCGAPSPAQSLVWQVPGDARQDHLGASVAYLPDVDGDGVVDVLVGSPSDPFTGIPGRAAIFSGASRKQLFEWVGDGLGDALGASVASLGDVDGDGVADVAIGARFRSVGSAQGGAVFTYSGATGALLFSYLNATAHASLGASVAGLGDVDGDGVGDLLVGAPSDAINGSATVLSGRTGAVVRTHSGTYLSSFGWCVDLAGDVDADGVPDYVVGAPNDTSTTGKIGVAYVYSGASGATLFSLADPQGVQRFASVASGAGDVDLDGHADLLVGNPGWSNGGANGDVGAVWVFSGATGNPLFARQGSDWNEQLGTAISETGDFDGDGHPDVVATTDDGGAILILSGVDGSVLGTFAPTGVESAAIDATADLNKDGVADLLAGYPGSDGFQGGGTAGRAVVLSPVDGSLKFNVHGKSYGEQCGRAITVLADRDGDGQREVAIGFPGGTDSSVGFVSIASGSDGHELARILGGNGSSGYGRALTSLGDLNGDGVPDYAIGGDSSGAGGVDVRSGSDDSLLKTLHPSSGESGFGSALASATEAGGAVLLAVGSPSSKVGSLANAGAFDLFDLTQGTLRLHVGGSKAQANFGSALAAVGDVDGDGLLEWIVGASNDSISAGSGGVVRLLSGKDGSTRWLHDDPNQGALGTAVAAAGDLDGDGIGDALAGAPFGGATTEGYVAAYSGANGAQLFELDGESLDAFGSAICGLGDVNGDGLGDFAIGAPFHLWNDQKRGMVALYSGRTAALLERFDGLTDGELLGGALATTPLGGDTRVDPDPIPDLPIGAPDNGTGSAEAGLVELHRLASLFLQIDPPSAAAGQPVDLATRGGPSGNVVGLYAVALNGAPIGRFLAFGTFDGLGIWSLTGTVPNGLAGSTLTLRSYAISWNGVSVTQDESITFQ